MQEALMLFDSIANSQWFVRTAIILFLNKMDLFKSKLARSSIREYFPDYTGDEADYKPAGAYFKSKFEGLNRNPAKV
jgi:guanine nucleotide-binding protein subunit alpha, other